VVSNLTKSLAKGVSPDAEVNRMQSRRRKIAVYVLIIVATLVLIALPIWLGTGPVVLAPGIDP
jgi:hypothetical protein